MALLDRRDRETGIIEGRFITHVLNEQGDEILKDSKKQMKGFTSAKWSRNKMTINDNTLTYDTVAATRFVDMKTRRSKGYTRGNKKIPPGKKKKKSFPIHNKPIFRHKKNIIRTLSFGFTDEVKNSFRQLAKNEGLI
ncbi:hypothetical protein CMU39_14205 [Elizabethkingia anophelis]|nr:hypothetical protein [Elizabethkingia anophelis]